VWLQLTRVWRRQRVLGQAHLAPVPASQRHLARLSHGAHQLRLRQGNRPPANNHAMRMDGGL
jgi:hypothetical protein